MKIVVEGGDAAGKFTQTTMLAEKLAATRFAFPNYESPTGQAILWHLKRQWACLPLPGRVVVDDSDVQRVLDARVFQSLQAVNRLESLPQIEAAAAAGHVVFDRYWQSACVYGSLDGLDTEWLRLVQERSMPAADINILIDVPVEEGFKRRPERRDRYEINRDFLEKVREKYLELWGDVDRDGWVWKVTRPGWVVVNGMYSVDEVHHTIMEIVRYQARGAL